jgi:hypothetical protein
MQKYIILKNNHNKNISENLKQIDIEDIILKEFTKINQINVDYKVVRHAQPAGCAMGHK